MPDAGTAMKERIRADLKAAMKDRRGGEATLLRTLIAAIDQAEAQPLPVDARASDQHDFLSGSAEVARRALDADAVRAVIEGEIEERERGAAAFERLGMTGEAEALRADTGIARRYLT